MKNWTKGEEEYLKEKWGIVKHDTIAMNLNKSKNAIMLKAGRLKLGDSRYADDKLSINAFIKATGITQYTIKKVWVENDFEFTKKKIDIEKFWWWARRNKKIVNFAKWEEGILGPEPDWAKEKRKMDKMDPSKINWNRKWTKEEDKKLIEYTKSCRYTYKDLSVALRRTENAVKRRLYDLKVQCRPVPLDNHLKWTDEENIRMNKLFDKGYSTQTIAKLLNKTQLSINDRINKKKVVSA